jgi:hypothetical protein
MQSRLCNAIKAVLPAGSWVKCVPCAHASAALPATDSHMSTSNQTTDLSAANFTAIFEAASNEYKTLTGQDLGTHPLATDLESNNSPDSILDVFRKQARVFDTFCKDDDKLMNLLTPIVHVVLTLSTTLGGIGLVSFHFPRFWCYDTSFILFLAILSRNGALCRYQCSSWCRSHL